MPTLDALGTTPAHSGSTLPSKPRSHRETLKTGDGAETSPSVECDDHDLDEILAPAEASEADDTEKYQELPVHEGLRRRILDEWPSLKNTGKRPLLRLLDFVISTTSRRDKNGDLMPLAIPVSRSRLIHFGHKTGSNSCNIQKLVEEFSLLLFPLDFMKASKEAHVCFRVRRPTLPEWLEAAVIEDLEDPSPDLIGLVGGEPLDRSAIERRLIGVADGRGPSPIDRIEAIRRRLNAIPRERFEDHVMPRIASAVRVARNIEDPYARAQAIATLGRVREMPKPVYARVENSVRLFAIGPNLLGLPGEVRDELTKCLVSADLVSSQLVIGSALWDLPQLLDYTGPECWADFLGRAGLPAIKKNKRVVKEAAFGGLYGSELTQIAYRAKKAILGQKAPGVSWIDRQVAEAKRSAGLIAEGPLVSLLVEGRKPVMNRLLGGEEFTDAFGQKMSVELTTEDGKGTGIRARTKRANGIMASIAQSYEAAIMVDLIEHCDAQGIEVLAWLHDGLYLEKLDEDQAMGIAHAVREASGRRLNGTEVEIKVER